MCNLRDFIKKEMRLTAGTGRGRRPVRFLGTVVCLVLTLSLVAACAPAQPTAAPQPTAATAATKAPTAAPQANQAGTPKRGGTLTIGYSGDVSSYDPYIVISTNQQYTLSYYDRLIELNKELKIVPRLAEKLDVSADGKTYTLKLRQGVKFHSGKAFSADDVVWNLKRAMNKDTGASLYSGTLVVDNVKALDASTVQITLKDVDASFTSVLQEFVIIDPAGEGTIKNRPAGIGPFKFTEWVPADHYSGERFADYWDKSLPYVDKFVTKTFGDYEAMIAALEAGSVDLALEVANKDVARLKDKFNVIQGAPVYAYDIRINPKRAPFDKKEVRQAMQYAVDRKTIVDKVLFGVGDPVVTPFIPGSPAYDPSLVDKYPLDLAKAKTLMEKSGVKGAKVTLLISTAIAELLPIAQVLQADWTKIGLDVEIQSQDATQFNARMMAGEYNVMLGFGWSGANYPTRMSSQSFSKLKGNVLWGDVPPQAWVDAVLASNSAVDPAKQKVAFAKMNAALVDESWYIAIATRGPLTALAKYVKGFNASIMGYPMIEGVWLDK